MEFTKIKQFIEERANMSVKQAVVKQERDSALEEVQALKAEFEATMRRSLETGQDAGKALDALSVRIEEAERTFKRKEREAQVAAAVFQPKMTSDDIITAWNTEFKPAFKRRSLTRQPRRCLRQKGVHCGGAAVQGSSAGVRQYPQYGCV